MTKREPSLAKRVVAFVEAHGQSTIDQVVAACSRHVGTAAAMRAYDKEVRMRDGRVKGQQQRRTKLDHCLVGSRRMITNYLLRAAKDGKLRRVKRGVYAPAKKR